jgi:hypothetical protein
MNSRRKVATQIARLLFALAVLAVALGLLIKASLHPATAQSPAQSLPSPNFRILENRVPEHLPIRVQIKRGKEKTFRNLDNQDWARDLELEVKNVGDKPIYFLLLQLHVPEAKIGNGYQNFTIVYGRVGLSDLNVKPTIEDVPIKSGETRILKIEDVGVRGWEAAIQRGLVPPRIHGVRLVFEDLSFGDGTGYEGGSPRPEADKKGSPGACLQPPNDYGGKTDRALSLNRVTDAQSLRDQGHAGKFQPASFFPQEFTISASFISTRLALPETECNCANDTCEHLAFAGHRRSSWST